MDLLDTKGLARSKHQHSLTKDKNRFKKKAKYLKHQKQKQEQQNHSAVRESSEQSSLERKEALNEQPFERWTRSKFSRRIIENNEYRYMKEENEQDEDDNETSSDLNKLLSHSPVSDLGTISQFRFKTEREWDDNEEIFSKNKVTAYHIDWELFAQTMRQLSLPRRLHLEPVYFTSDISRDEMMGSMNSTTSTSSTKFPNSSISIDIPSSKTSTPISIENVDILSPSSAFSIHPNHTIADTSSKNLPEKKEEIVGDLTSKEDEALLDSLLRISIRPTVSMKEKESNWSTTKKTESIDQSELEEWLESVL